MTIEGKQRQRNIFNKVLDLRGRRIRGLWIRNGVYYAQMRVAGSVGATRIKLEHATTVPQAMEAMQALKRDRRDGKLHVVKARSMPTFGEAAKAYMDEMRALDSNGTLTLRRKEVSFNALNRVFGATPVNKITAKDVYAFATARKGEGVSGHTVDIDVAALRMVMRKCERDGHIRQSPIREWRLLATKPAKKRLLTQSDIDALCEFAIANMTGGAIPVPGIGRAFADYLQLLATSGAREQEGLAMKWSTDIDFDRQQISLHGKFSKSRWMPFNPRLEAHLKDMATRRKGASDWLFPSHRRKGARVQSFQSLMQKLKKLDADLSAANKTPRAIQDDFGFHHLRHYFISHCVMSGVDFRTIADWVGHEDGGVLIGRTYSHLSDKHSKAQAAKVGFQS